MESTELQNAKSLRGPEPNYPVNIDVSAASPRTNYEASSSGEIKTAL
jgi:hypothetical protein